jgi:hypothetical protein
LNDRLSNSDFKKSPSRVRPDVVPSSATALAALKEKWSAQFAEDQAYNSHLDLAGPGFTLRTQ